MYFHLFFEKKKEKKTSTNFNNTFHCDYVVDDDDDGGWWLVVWLADCLMITFWCAQLECMRFVTRGSPRAVRNMLFLSVELNIK